MNSARGGPSFDTSRGRRRAIPWDVRRFTGGSSSGFGSRGRCRAVLSVRSAPIPADRSVFPAAYCGDRRIEADSPDWSPGAVFIPLAPSLDAAGPMAWTARGLRDPARCDRLVTIRRTRPRCAGLETVHARCGRGAREEAAGRACCVHFYERDVPAAPRGAAHDDAGRRGAPGDLGCRVEDAILPPLQEDSAVCRVIISAEAYAMHEVDLADAAFRLLPCLFR